MFIFYRQQSPLCLFLVRLVYDNGSRPFRTTTGRGRVCVRESLFNAIAVARGLSGEAVRGSVGGRYPRPAPRRDPASAQNLHKPKRARALCGLAADTVEAGPARFPRQRVSARKIPTSNALDVDAVKTNRRCLSRMRKGAF